MIQPGGLGGPQGGEEDLASGAEPAPPKVVPSRSQRMKTQKAGACPLGLHWGLLSDLLSGTVIWGKGCRQLQPQALLSGGLDGVTWCGGDFRCQLGQAIVPSDSMKC